MPKQASGKLCSQKSVFTKYFNHIFKYTVEGDKHFYLEHTFMERQNTVIVKKNEGFS